MSWVKNLLGFVLKTCKPDFSLKYVIYLLNNNKVRSKWLQFLIDYFIIEIVECFIMNFIWYGFQNYFDSLIFPNDYFMRLTVTFACSHGICLFVLLIQYKIFKFVSKFSLVPRLIVEDSMNIIMIILNMIINFILLIK